MAGGKGILATVIVAVIGIAAAAGLYSSATARDEQQNSNLNDVVAQCEEWLRQGMEPKLRACDDRLITMMEDRCNENHNYDICQSTRISDYYRARASDGQIAAESAPAQTSSETTPPQKVRLIVLSDPSVAYSPDNDREPIAVSRDDKIRFEAIDTDALEVNMIMAMDVGTRNIHMLPNSDDEEKNVFVVDLEEGQYRLQVHATSPGNSVHIFYLDVT